MKVGRGPGPTMLREPVVVVIEWSRASVNDDLTCAERVEQLAKTAKWQTEGVGGGPAAASACCRKVFADLTLDERGAQACLADGFRLRGPEVVVRKKDGS